MAQFHSQQLYNRDSFKITERIIGASRHSVQLKGDNGEIIFCHNKVFNVIMQNPSIAFDIEVVPEHEDYRAGRFFPKTMWIRAYVPTRF